MRASPWSIGIVMLILAGATIGFPLHQAVALTAPMLIVAGALLVGGAALFVRHPARFWVALAGGVIPTGFAAVGVFRQQPLGLPMPPLVSLVLGLYVCFRVVTARGQPAPSPPSDGGEPRDG